MGTHDDRMDLDPDFEPEPFVLPKLEYSVTSWTHHQTVQDYINEQVEKGWRFVSLSTGRSQYTSYYAVVM